MKFIMRIEMSGCSIVVPERWIIVIGDRQDWLRLFLDGKVNNDEGGSTIASTGLELSFECVEPPTRSTIAEYADDVMRRHVGQGAPEVSSRDVDGRQARVYEWTNGIQRIESVFVEIPERPDFRVLRVDVVRRVAFDGTVVSGMSAIGILESLTWH